jgi:hypothetical protein
LIRASKYWAYSFGFSQVADNIIIDWSEFHVRESGIHTLKFWAVDPGIVLQKIVAGFRQVNPGYLGPPETRVE